MGFTPCLLRTARPSGGELIRLGHPLLDAYLDLVTARARPNTVLATAFDLKVFFGVVDKDPVEVLSSDVLGLSSWLSVSLASVPRSSASRTARAACRLAPASGGWPRSLACTST